MGKILTMKPVSFALFLTFVLVASAADIQKSNSPGFSSHNAQTNLPTLPEIRSAAKDTSSTSNTAPDYTKGFQNGKADEKSRARTGT